MPERTITLPDDLTEDEALDLSITLDQKFGWAGTVVTRGDVEAILDTPLTDDQWLRLRNSRDWQVAVAEAMAEAGVAVVHDITRDVLPELNDR